MRAILLASATATTLNGLRSRSFVSQGYFSGLMARVSQHCAGSDHQNSSQIAIAPFRDRPELLFAASRVFARHEPDPGREVTTRSKNLRIRDGRCDRGGSDKTNSGDALEPLARLAQAVLHNDAFLDRSDQRLHRLKLRRQHDKARVSIDRQARIRFASNDLQQFLDPVTPLRSHNAELGQMRRMALITWVRCRIKRSRARCNINRPCCSVDLICTKRTVGRRAASQIASASAASFLLRLT